jgi:hypothetical protein
MKTNKKLKLTYKSNYKYYTFNFEKYTRLCQQQLNMK